MVFSKILPAEGDWASAFSSVIAGVVDILCPRHLCMRGIGTFVKFSDLHGFSAAFRNVAFDGDSFSAVGTCV